jgi:PadR family transcriptional regulator PadR
MLLLAEGKAFHGYELADRVNEMSVTDVPIERGAVYRTLRALEANGNVASRWDTSGGGPARRLYHLTASGREHLAEWMEVLQRRAENLMSMTGEYAQAKRKVARS